MWLPKAPAVNMWTRKHGVLVRRACSGHTPLNGRKCGTEVADVARVADYAADGRELLPGHAVWQQTRYMLRRCYKLYKVSAAGI